MKKTRQQLLSAEETTQLLNGYGLHDNVPLGDLWMRKCAELQQLEIIVTSYLKESEMSCLVARGLSKEVRRRGVGHLTVASHVNGRLQLSFGRGPSRLPSMAELRKRAQEQGVDISGLGIKRREIVALLEKQGKLRIQPDEVSNTPLSAQVLKTVRGFSMDDLLKG